MDERVRQKLIRYYDHSDLTDDVITLYEKGWSILELAQSKQCKLQEVIDILEMNSISIDSDERKMAEQYLDLEKQTEQYQ
ncbi:hypothetical protein [Evansella halocellulosilytica]|uniref:hypothetical protein n=1 Tax=Evansella halocellulosilytica TaxID=2011013 RepID=UPI000BB8AD77|nr:hypothetical protein [Evansella halocellulosilytica]